MGNSKARVLVIGDVMLDRTIRGHATRLAPEAVVPVIKQAHASFTPGAAANVATNVSTLGGEAYLVGLVGHDHQAEQLRECLASFGISYDGLIRNDMPTTTKTRLYADRQMVARFDRETFTTNPEAILTITKAALKDWHPDIVVLSDYGKGSLYPPVVHEIISISKRYAPVIVDPKGTDFSIYCGATMLKPNLLESLLAINDSSDPLLVSNSKTKEIGHKLRAFNDVGAVLITRGHAGMIWCGIEDELESTIEQAAFHPQMVYDVTGAGDTTAAALAVALAEKNDIRKALQFAACAAGLVVGKIGTATVSRSEIRQECSHYDDPKEKFLADNTALDLWVRHHRNQGRRIVFTNGCFDLLHYGHLHSLQFARSCGDSLLVCINNDAAVSRLKGPGRPVVNQAARIAMLAALECVDGVTVFNDDPTALIELVKPDVLVKGEEYKNETVIGADLLNQWGGILRFVPMAPTWSTTSILQKLN